MAIGSEYVKLTHREQILLRPDTYVGSVLNENREYWFYNKETNKIELINNKYNPGYIKIFDEILTNASDHAIRTGKVTYIKINVGSDFISIENDGPGIPVAIHEKEKVYIPELIFGHLLTSQNYDDSEERFVGGRNGYGAKLCAIFSKNFIIETCDGKKGYFQNFENNLSIINKPSLKGARKQFTRITYYPDFDRFNSPDNEIKLTENDSIIQGILHKRAADIAAYNPKVEVYFNDILINVRKFEDYINLYGIDEVYYTRLNDNWEIAITNGTSAQVSLVNGIATNSGGTHVTYISNYIGNEIKTLLYKKIKDCTLTLNEIKSKFMVFISCKIANPVFETQTKETLTTKITADITKTFKITDAYIKKLFKSSIIETILDWYNQKQNADASKLARELNKKLDKIKVDKLIDAKGDGKDRTKCILSLFEGDSAQGAFRKYRDPITQGAFSLGGKFINANDITYDKLVKNDDAMRLIASMGLKLGEKAKLEKLRYGKIFIYTDADHDGSSIAALVINFIYNYWPELFEYRMIYKVETPIVVSTSSKTKKNKISFYSQSEYEKWLDKVNPKDWSIKYKKGLAALQDDEYEDIIKEPRLILISSNESTKDSLNTWFGDDSDLRKIELLK
jgi:DNA topoisomerase-2